MSEGASMTQILENVDKAINETPSEVARFVPNKYRSVNSSASLSVIHTDIRNKTINSLDDDIRREEEHLIQLKSVRDELKRIIG